MRGQSTERFFFPELEIESDVSRNDDDAGWCAHDACMVRAEPDSLLCAKHKDLAEEYFLGQLCRDPIAHLKKNIPVKARWCWLYFVGSRESGTVKIGITRNLKKRMNTLRNTSPVPIKLFHVICTYPTAESALHNRLKDDRIHGEWFNLTDDVNGCIEDLKARESSEWLPDCELPKIWDQLEDLAHVVTGLEGADTVSDSDSNRKVCRALDMLRNLCLNSEQ